MNDRELDIKKVHARETKNETERMECRCIDMINSILCYNCRGWKDAEKVLQYEEQSYHNYLADYTRALGRNRVIELIDGQIRSIAHVNFGVYTDCDGLTYNSIVWA